MRSIRPSTEQRRARAGARPPAGRASRTSAGRWANAAAVGGLAALLGGGCGGTLEEGAAKEPSPEATPTEPAEQPPLPRAGLFRRGADALVRIETPHRIGAGFVADEDGRIVTDFALLQHERIARVVLGNGRSLPVERVLVADPELDLAVLSVEADDLPELDLAEGKPPQVGSPVFVLGYELGMVTPTLAEVVVGSKPDGGEDETFLISGPVQPGFVGAPVLDDRGRVLGLVAGEPGEVTTVAPAAQISDLLGRVEPGGGETMLEFGDRTRREEGWTDRVPLLPKDALADCSSESQEWMWLELGRSLEIAAAMDAIGVPEAAFRVIEGAVLRLHTDVPDCRDVLGVLKASVDSARTSAEAHPALDTVAQTLEGVLELLFAVPKRQQNAPGPVA